MDHWQYTLYRKSSWRLTLPYILFSSLATTSLPIPILKAPIILIAIYQQKQRIITLFFSFTNSQFHATHWSYPIRSFLLLYHFPLYVLMVITYYFFLHTGLHPQKKCRLISFFEIGSYIVMGFIHGQVWQSSKFKGGEQEAASSSLLFLF